MEASALPVTPGIAPPPLRVPAPLLRFRSDDQLVSLFRRGHEEAFRAIHERYHDRLLAYTRQMLPGLRHDAEDALQEVFVRAYRGLRVDNRDVALRPWLYRVAHNRCIDVLRCQIPAAVDSSQEQAARPVGSSLQPTDPSVQAERREELARLVTDIQRLPDQQRSALLMRELGGMGHVEIGEALGVTVPAVKSLLVRARVGLVEAAEARDASCAFVQRELALAHERGARPSPLARRHLRDCTACGEFRTAIRGTSRQAAALLPGLGAAGLLGRLLGIGGGGGGAAASGAAAGGAASAGGGSAAVAGVTSAGALGAGVSHVATLVAAAVVTAGGAVAIQPSIPPQAHPSHPSALRQSLVRAAASGAGGALATALLAPAPEPAAGLTGSAASLLALAQPTEQAAVELARPLTGAPSTQPPFAPSSKVALGSPPAPSTVPPGLPGATAPSGSQTPSGAQSPAGAQPPAGATVVLVPDGSGSTTGAGSTTGSATTGSDPSRDGSSGASGTSGSTSPSTSSAPSSATGPASGTSATGSSATSGTSSTNSSTSSGSTTSSTGSGTSSTSSSSTSSSTSSGSTGSSPTT